MVGRGSVTDAGQTRPAANENVRSSWRRGTTIAGGAALFVLLIYFGARALLPGTNGPLHLVVYAFSTQEEVLTQSIFPAFEAAWEAETGRELTIDGVFGLSSLLAGQINLGAPADVALFSNAHHVTYLRIGRQIKDRARSGVIGVTPMVIVTRPGNPLSISGYKDLAQTGVCLLHADPRSSGGGEWAVLAEFGSALMTSDDETAAAAQLSAIWRNVCLLAPSARTTLTLFELGAGDALVTYEQDALLALERGVALDIVMPPRTIVAEPVAIIVDANVTPAERPAAEAFVRYLLSAEGQRQFADYYQRPVTGESAAFRPLTQPFSVEDLGGWSSAHRRIVETLWQEEIEPRLDLDTSTPLLQPNPAAGGSDGNR